MFLNKLYRIILGLLFLGGGAVVSLAVLAGVYLVWSSSARPGASHSEPLAGGYIRRTSILTDTPEPGLVPPESSQTLAPLQGVLDDEGLQKQTASITPTPSPTGTGEFTQTGTISPTATDTPIPYASPTRTWTKTPTSPYFIPASPTHTTKYIPPTKTNTSRPPATKTNTPRPTNTNPPSSTATHTLTNTPPHTATNTLRPSATYTPSQTPSRTNTPPQTATPTHSRTPTPSNTPGPTNTPTRTNTPVTPTNTPSDPSPTPTIDISGCTYWTHSSFENELLILINEARADAGLGALRMHAYLRAAAREHSTDMACNSFVSHIGSNGTTSYDRITAYGYYPSWWGENIYKGWDATPQFVFEWWMNSTPHRNNILGANYTNIGIGHAGVSYQNQNAYTLNFGRP